MKKLLGVLLLLAAGMPVQATANVVSHDPPVGVTRQSRGTVTSSNWSGYAAFAPGTTFTDVKASWIQPEATCSPKQSTYASFFVGIDGYNSSTVEQIGTDADCIRGIPQHYAWYEMYPAATVRLSLAVNPGDTINVDVSRLGSTFTLTIKVNAGEPVVTQQTVNGLAASSAEWVAEAPSSGGRVLPLTNFGTISFSGSFATGNGATGSISNSAWSNDQIRMTLNRKTTKAQPSALSPDGAAFSVSWLHT